MTKPVAMKQLQILWAANITEPKLAALARVPWMLS
jgi:hypothetical protein